MTIGQRLADKFAATMGSWRFIILQSIVLCAWVTLNVTAHVRHWDNYPFILLNLALSFQAAYSAPIIMMSQNRQADIDRAKADEDFKVNKDAEREIQDIQAHLHRMEKMITELHAKSRTPGFAPKRTRPAHSLIRKIR